RANAKRVQRTCRHRQEALALRKPLITGGECAAHDPERAAHGGGGPAGLIPNLSVAASAALSPGRILPPGVIQISSGAPKRPSSRGRARTRSAERRARSLSSAASQKAKD